MIINWDEVPTVHLSQILLRQDKYSFRPGGAKIKLFCVECKKTSTHHFKKEGYDIDFLYCTICQLFCLNKEFKNIYSRREILSRSKVNYNINVKNWNEQITYSNLSSKYKVDVTYSVNYKEHVKFRLKFEEANNFLENYFLLK